MKKILVRGENVGTLTKIRRDSRSSAFKAGEIELQAKREVNS